MGRALNNKTLVAFSAIGSQKSAATEETEDTIKQLLDYVAAYPDDGILFRKSYIILAAHTDEYKARSIAGTCIFLSENDPKPKINGPVLNIAQIIESVMDSAAESEMAALYIAAKNMIPLRNTLI